MDRYLVVQNESGLWLIFDSYNSREVCWQGGLPIMFGSQSAAEEFVHKELTNVVH